MPLNLDNFLLFGLLVRMFKRLRIRGRIEITAEIIRLCIEGKKKTTIMYGANLSYDQLKQYLRELEEQQFVEKVMIDGNIFYRATHRGRNYLAAYEELVRMIKFSIEDKS